jgi:hypothetical protein
MRVNTTLKESIKDYVENFDPTNCFGVTLTMKQRADNKSLDNISSSRNLRHFLNVLNKKCFGNAFKRFDKRLRVFPSLERSSIGRWHYHLVLENPFPSNPMKFERMIESAWFKTSYKHRHIDIKHKVNAGWGDYITKFDHRDNEIDWGNLSP